MRARRRTAYGSRQLSIAGCVCRVGASLVAVEQLLDFLLVHRVEVVWHGELTLHEIEPPRRSRGIDGNDLDQRLPRLRDNERLALVRSLDQAREVSLGLVDIDGSHGQALNLVRLT